MSKPKFIKVGSRYINIAAIAQVDMDFGFGKNTVAIDYICSNSEVYSVILDDDDADEFRRLFEQAIGEQS